MSFFTGKNILVTGGAGLCGHGIIRRALDEGAFVYATIRGDSITYSDYGDGLPRVLLSKKFDIVHPNLMLMPCDLLDYADCLKVAKGMDIVFHAASSTAGAAGQTDASVVAKLVRESVILGTNMMSAAVESGVDRFGFIGSSTMYPDLAFPVREEAGFDGDPWKGYMGVGWMKRYLEKAAAFYSTLGLTKFVLVRTTAVYGPHDHFDLKRGHVIPALVLKFTNKMNPLEVWGDGNDVRNFIYIDDLVDGLFRLVEKGDNCNPYNIATREVSTVNDILTALTTISGFQPKIIYDNTKPSMIPYRTVSVDKIERDFGWQAKVSLAEGLAKTVAWCKEQNYGKA